jgi:regulator of protease activity HflC (stomatin/prohibitin superfamily)
MFAASSSHGPPIAILLVLGAIFVGGLVVLTLLRGFLIVQPRTQVVVLRFGSYVETIASEGIHWVFPIGIELRRMTSSVISLDLPKMTVLDATGSPIEVSGICSYRVAEAHRAALEIADVGEYVRLLATAVLKNVCAEYPYEAANPSTPCLRKENDTIARHLVDELQRLTADAGVEILQLRMNDLAYAPEIAQSMLLRQQASSMIAARRTLVEGATETVKSAVSRMDAAGIELRGPALERFVASMMLVLTSGERVHTMMPIDLESEKG